ncbi:siderophore-interacting protein [Phytopseudomonas dryadis]|uniref:NADPH-dependent ferric siderophore reductase n=1 Tax=Phytopseudomonas dryadis TaxID=2487520 RepID=A0A4Q9QUK8_9GAMM|nr:siderophore-interacting protein [Pseudomonas dryadis]TBU87096.1 NADPH-dependent ferric siderophore reductase [Pseudomonas dryadis]
MTATASNSVQRVMHDIVRRRLAVARVVDITPRMRRVTFTGSELQGFVSAAADDHIKLLFASNAEERRRLDDFLAGRDGDRPVMRDYTPRRYDAGSGELDVDFVLHGDGPAATWAAQAQPGQHLHIAGPRSSLVVPDIFDSYLLIGDETALPAIGRWLEGLAPGRRVTVLVEIEDEAEKQALPSAAEVSLHWLMRNDRRSLVDAAAELQLPAGDLYAWVACEASQSRKIRRLLIEQHGVDEERLKAAGYWRRDDETTA